MTIVLLGRYAKILRVHKHLTMHHPLLRMCNSLICIELVQTALLSENLIVACLHARKLSFQVHGPVTGTGYVWPSNLLEQLIINSDAKRRCEVLVVQSVLGRLLLRLLKVGGVLVLVPRVAALPLDVHFLAKFLSGIVIGLVVSRSGLDCIGLPAHFLRGEVIVHHPWLLLLGSEVVFLRPSINLPFNLPIVLLSFSH